MTNIKADPLREALGKCLECITAAECEGLTEVISELRGFSEQTDHLIGLVERRLLWVREYAQPALASAPQPPAPKENIGSPEWDRAIKAVSQPLAPLGGREELAETIHKARWPADRAMAITPFTDEDRNGREYCFRIADAILAAVTPTALASDRAANLAYSEAARIIEVHAQEMRNCNLTLTPDGLSSIAKAVRALVAKGDVRG